MMLRWFKKRYQRPDSGKHEPGSKKDEYGFDGENDSCFVRQVEHIYEEIPDVPSPSDVKRRTGRGNRNGERRRGMPRDGPELPPRNTARLSKHRASYAQWRFQALSRKTLSLPELVEVTNSTDSSVLSECSEDILSDMTASPVDHRIDGRNRHSVRQCRELSNHEEDSLEDLVREFDQSLITGFQDGKYFPQESDSGYDYSGSSSNGSDVNDSGLSGSYEFHLSKVEQLRRIEQEIHNLSTQSHSDFSSRARSKDRLLKKRQRLFADKSRDRSLGSLSSCASVTSDLDFDDEIAAYGERADFSSCEDVCCRKALPGRRQQPLATPTHQDRHSTRHQKHDTAAMGKQKAVGKQGRCTVIDKPRDNQSILKCSTPRRSCRGDASSEDSSVSGETTPRYKRPSASNRLLGDLILKNNDNLFFA